MPQPNYEKEITGLALIDPYNDFISEGGKKMLFDEVGPSTLPDTRRATQMGSVARNAA